MGRPKCGLILLHCDSPQYWEHCIMIETFHLLMKRFINIWFLLILSISYYHLLVVYICVLTNSYLWWMLLKPLGKQATDSCMSCWSVTAHTHGFVIICQSYFNQPLSTGESTPEGNVINCNRGQTVLILTRWSQVTWNMHHVTSEIAIIFAFA